MHENKAENHIPIDQSFWRTIGLISGDEHLFYVLKKTEKIVTALYLVTNLIKDISHLRDFLIRISLKVFFALFNR